MGSAGHKLQYRADIDGLRAVAILAVVAYHAGIPGFGAGYLGVDVFFVISGFLITSLLWSEQLASGRIDLASFYARRARRLLPALAAVLLAVTVAGLLLMNPGFELKGLAREVLTTSVFASNILFWRTGGYFAAPAINLPLLHTWTLAVEEQFYLAWPCLLILVGGLVRTAGARARTVVAVLAALTVLSWMAAFLMPRRFDHMAFYLSPFRAWEFGVGALVAFLPRALTGPKGVLPAAGLLVLLTCLLLNRDFSSAGLVAVATVGATATVIAGGGGPSAGLAARFLSLRPVVAIGLVSYAWYLWHWPALSFVRVVTVTGPEPVRDGLISLATLGLAVLTWRFVEQPVRRLKTPAFSSTRRALVSGAVIVAAGGAMAGLLFAAGSLAPKPASMAARIEASRSYWQAAEYRCSDAVMKPQNCSFGPKATDAILLTGDSHAAMIRSGLVDLANTSGDFQLVSRTLSSCRPVLRSSASDDQCERHNRAVAAETPDLIRNGLKGVVLGAYWGSPGFGHIGDLAAQIRAWRGAGVRVAIVAESPIFPYGPRDCLLHRPASYCGFARAEFERQRAAVMQQLRAAAGADPQVRIFDLSSPYCDAVRCEVLRDGRLFFHDNQHLTVEGGQALAPVMKEMTDWLLERPSS